MPKTFHAHWRDADLSRWRWPNFSTAEIACRGTGRLLIDEEALDRLQALRDALGKQRGPEIWVECDEFIRPLDKRRVLGPGTPEQARGWRSGQK